MPDSGRRPFAAQGVFSLPVRPPPYARRQRLYTRFAGHSGPESKRAVAALLRANAGLRPGSPFVPEKSYPPKGEYTDLSHSAPKRVRLPAPRPSGRLEQTAL